MNKFVQPFPSCPCESPLVFQLEHGGDPLGNLCQSLPRKEEKVVIAQPGRTGPVDGVEFAGGTKPRIHAAWKKIKCSHLGDVQVCLKT